VNEGRGYRSGCFFWLREFWMPNGDVNVAGPGRSSRAHATAAKRTAPALAKQQGRQGASECTPAVNNNLPLCVVVLYTSISPSRLSTPPARSEGMEAVFALLSAAVPEPPIAVQPPSPRRPPSRRRYIP
jgi:hypothetical protein